MFHKYIRLGMLMSAEIARNNKHFELVIMISSQFLRSSFHHAS